MGFDITFHPVSLAELQRFVFDVIDDPRLMPARVAELTDDADGREVLTELFGRTLRAIERDAIGDDEALGDSDDEDDEDDVGAADEAVRNLAATVAGCLHPYWYSRGGGLTFVHDPSVAVLIRSYTELARGRVRTIAEPDGPYISGNGSSTGFIPPEGVAALARRLDARDPALLEGLGESGAEALKRALAYAVERGLGLIEAADLVIPGNLD